ncbi:addiction module toxin [Rhodanobacter sp. B05]|jgi:addiction module RelE/StbE family toxin|uniref:type II toxin-antitoxin system RelE/ParE family toxin n=1 Tax=Rhodanobacter sp. B05 TaxID=1945859 RepID=UPI0009875A4A|nr:type II toxin-antitoxin system mRNA interferase toxin, RelE/StbE family [Rhodanobacter sp. B05]OOG60552.1 addiction module toxin [Rhodanobacter sp. B05]
MWTILESRQADKELSSGRVPMDILKRYEKWKDIAMISGPQGLRSIKGFRDESLSGGWKGFRSSRLNEQWLVIYSIEADVMSVQVVRVTPHDDRKR